MSLDIESIKRLNAQTGVGLTGAKQALHETDGDYEKAYEALRVKGLAKAANKAERIAKAGLIQAYVHGNKIGVLVEVNCETDFVARTDDFKLLANELALHIAAASPRYLTPDDIPPDTLVKERELLTAELRESGKPENMIEQIVEGKLEKFYAEVCLMRQGFIKDPELLIEELVKSYIAKLGENIVVRRFSRLELGEVVA